MKGILGTKVGMTQIWKNDKVVPVTVVLAGPCPVVQRKEPSSDGYSAVQLGFMDVKKARATKPLTGHFAKAGVSPMRFLREFRDFSPEQGTITVEIFEGG